MAFDWGSLKPGSLIVDVGGGLGHVSMVIGQEYPDLKFAVEDRTATVQDAILVRLHSYPQRLFLF